MNIIDFAMQMESDGEQYYRRMAASADNPGLKQILLMLAEEEVRHYQALGKCRTGSAALEESDLLTDAKNIFGAMQGQVKPVLTESSQASLYQHALDIEIKSRDFYREKADQTEKGYQQQLFRILSAEEDKHVVLIENILDFISRPTAWLENAEFTHLDEY